MKDHGHRYLTCVVALVAVTIFPSPLSAQERPREHIYLPPTWGVTPLSAAIESQAKYVAAQGDFMESVAIARKINAEAVEHELENHLKRIDTYFEGRARNKAYRAQENPNFAMKEAQRQKAMRDKITDYFQSAMNGDVTRELNWLLNELAGPILTLQYSADQWLLEEFNFPLHTDAAYHIRLTDRGSRGQRMVFRAADPKPLQTDWPTGLRGPQFDDVRLQFQNARDDLMKELAELERGEQLPFETGEEAVKAVDALFTALEEVYPKERRRDASTFVEYNTAKRYLLSLLAGVFRAIETNDRGLFDGSYQFEGKSVLDLLNHICQNGLEFAPPEAGDEGTYKILFETMRTIYLRLTEEEAIPNAGA